MIHSNFLNHQLPFIHLLHQTMDQRVPINQVQRGQWDLLSVNVKRKLDLNGSTDLKGTAIPGLHERLSAKGKITGSSVGHQQPKSQVDLQSTMQIGCPNKVFQQEPPLPTHNSDSLCVCLLVVYHWPNIQGRHYLCLHLILNCHRQFHLPNKSGNQWLFRVWRWTPSFRESN